MYLIYRLIAFFWIGGLYAEGPNTMDSAREKCRMQISGEYILQFDQSDASKARLEDLQQRKIKAESTLREHIRKNAAKEESHEAFQKKIVLEHQSFERKKKTLENYQQSLSSLIPEAMQTRRRHQKSFEEFRELVEPVMAIETRPRPLRAPFRSSGSR